MSAANWIGYFAYLVDQGKMTDEEANERLIEMFEADIRADEADREVVELMRSSREKFDSDLKKIIALYSVTEEHAGCYLCNFDDEYICHKYNGGCEKLEQCRQIKEIIT